MLRTFLQTVPCLLYWGSAAAAAAASLTCAGSGIIVLIRLTVQTNFVWCIISHISSNKCLMCNEGSWVLRELFEESQSQTTLPSFKNMLGEKKTTSDLPTVVVVTLSARCSFSITDSSIFIRCRWNSTADRSLVLISDLASSGCFWPEA